MASNLRTWRRPWGGQPQEPVGLSGPFDSRPLLAAASVDHPAFTRSNVSAGAAAGGVGLLSTGGSTQYALADLAGGALSTTAGLTFIVMCTPSSVATDSAPAGLVNRNTPAIETFSELGFRTSASATWQVMIRGVGGRQTQDTGLPAVANKPVCLVMSCTTDATQIVGVNGAVVSKTVSNYSTLALDAVSVCGIRRPIVGSNSYQFSGVVHGVVVLGFALPASEVAEVSANFGRLFQPRRVWVPVLAGGGGTTISVPAGSLALTGFAPTVSATANQTIAVPAGALTLAGFAPTVNVGANQTISVPAGSLTMTGFAPTVNVGVNQNIAVPAGSLSLTGFAPTISTSANQPIAVPVGSLTLTGFAPTVVQTAHQTINVPLGTLVMAGYAPTVSASGSYTISVPLGALVLTGHAPVVNNSGASATVTVKLGSWIRYKILT